MEDYIKEFLEQHPDLTTMHGNVDIVDKHDDHDILLFEDGYVYILKHDPR